MSDLPDSETRRRKVFAANDVRQLRQVYDEWADQYDADIETDLGFAGPSEAAAVFQRYVATTARVLDAGAGTGLAGKALGELGYTDLHALDASFSMLLQAKRKGVYRSFTQMFLGPSVALASNVFDAVMSVGTLTSGHVEASVLPELTRIVRPAGHVCFTLVPDFGKNSGYYQMMDRLENEGAWEKQFVSPTFPTFTHRPQNSDYNVWVYRVN